MAAMNPSVEQPNKRRILTGDPVTDTSRATIWLAFVVLISAAILGYTALFELFVAISILPFWLAVFFPVLFDAAEVFFAFNVLNAELQGEEDRYSWRMVIVFTALGVIANCAHSYLAYLDPEGINAIQAIAAGFFTSLFPLSIALVTQGWKIAIKRRVKRDELVATNARLAEQIEASRSRLTEAQAELEALQKSAEEQKTALEAERSTLEAQIAELLAEIEEAKAERRRAKKGQEWEPSGDTEARAWTWLEQEVRTGKRNSQINGSELGRAIGTSPSFGRRLKNKLLPQVRSDLGIMEPATNGTG
jgi:hypothetical protein